METEALLDLDIFADEDHRMVLHSPTTDVDKSEMMEPITPFDEDEKMNDENELELLKSQDSVLWGDEESDEEDYLTNNSYLTAGDILSQRTAIDVPLLTTDDMKNIFGSPASDRVRNKDTGYGTDSEQSAGSESGDDADESDQEEKTKKSGSKKVKKEKESLPNKKSAVQAEIDVSRFALSLMMYRNLCVQAVKKLESGPSEAELRRRRLIEIDQDEMEDRIERINRVALKAISSATGWTAEEQLKQVFCFAIFTAIRVVIF